MGKRNSRFSWKALATAGAVAALLAAMPKPADAEGQRSQYRPAQYHDAAPHHRPDGYNGAAPHHVIPDHRPRMPEDCWPRYPFGDPARRNFLFVQRYAPGFGVVLGSYPYGAVQNQWPLPMSQWGAENYPLPPVQDVQNSTTTVNVTINIDTVPAYPEPQAGPEFQPEPQPGPEKRVHVFGYDGRICPSQYVSEATGLMNNAFAVIAEQGEEQYHAYTFERAIGRNRYEQFCGIRRGDGTTVARIMFTDLMDKEISGPAFVERVSEELYEKTGIDVNLYVDVTFRNYGCGEGSR